MSYFYNCILYFKNPNFQPLWIGVDNFVKEKVLIDVPSCNFRDDSMKDDDKHQGQLWITTHRIIFWDN